ncbi:MAG: cell division protein FtsA [Treponema sp.]|jgi:cell division protein FtsA|nr:cell division protein FtsA [Treponema sp.]
MADDRIIVGLDIGTSVIRAAVGEVDDEGALHIVSTSSRKSAGLRNGVIVNIEDAKDAIKETLEKAETNGGVLINSVIASIGGSQIESQNSRGVVPIRNNSKGGSSAVTPEDVEKVIDIATAINYPADREKIHVIPQDYLVDGVGHISDPINRLGFKLESKVHIITASKTIIQNIKTCMDRAGYGLDGVMLKTLAETQAVCHEDELELGSIVIDLGAGTTDAIVLIDGAPISTTSVQVGGNLVTNDIAVVNGIPVAAAEKIKIEQGCCWAPCIQQDEDVILPGVGGRAPELTSKSEICKIITARMAQIFTMVKQAIKKNTSDSIKQMSGNIILTGGGAQMQGAVELAQEIFKTSSVRLGKPESLGGLEEEYRKPEFATAIGLVVANKGLVKARDTRRRTKKSAGPKNENKENFLTRLRKMFF